MNLSKLKPFIERSSKSGNLNIKKAADSLIDQMIAAQETEEIAQPTLHAQSGNKPLDQKPKDEVDQQIDGWMDDMAEPEPDESEFGKVAASYSADVCICDLPKATQQEIFKFIPSTNKNNKVVQYGMVVDELLPKVDHHNYEAALANVKKQCKIDGKKVMGDKFQDKVKDKYILILNDCIIDGHHFLALAQCLRITCSLKVLDLTPLRFQKTAAIASLFDYVIYNYSRQGAA
jgi:hypothetical protein